MYIYICLVNPIQDEPFLVCLRMGEAKNTPFLKNCHIYPTMMKLDKVMPYLKQIQKYKNHKIHFFSTADITIYSAEITNFCYTKKYRYRLHFNSSFLIFLTFFESLKIVLINMAAIPMMSAK